MTILSAFLAKVTAYGAHGSTVMKLTAPGARHVLGA